MSASNAWDQFLSTRRPDIGYKQHLWWADLLAQRGWGHFEVAVGNEDGDIVGGCRVMVESFAPGKAYYQVPDGPVLPGEPDEARRVFEATLRFIDEQRQADPWDVSHVRIEPRWTELPEFARSLKESRAWKEPRQTLLMDLSMSEDDLLAQMKRKGRYNTRLAGRKGVTIVEDASEQGRADFLSIYRETFDRHGIKGHSETYFGFLFERLLVEDRGTLYFAEYEGQRLATALVIWCGDTATYKYGGSTLAHRNVMAPYLLHFEIMRAAKARGHRWYDFYGISPPDKPDDRWAAFSIFKRKFGGTEVSFVPAMDYVLDEDAYAAYGERKKGRSRSR